GREAKHGGFDKNKGGDGSKCSTLCAGKNPCPSPKRQRVDSPSKNHPALSPNPSPPLNPNPSPGPSPGLSHMKGAGLTGSGPGPGLGVGEGAGQATPATVAAGPTSPPRSSSAAPSQQRRRCLPRSSSSSPGKEIEWGVGRGSWTRENRGGEAIPEIIGVPGVAEVATVTAVSNTAEKAPHGGSGDPSPCPSSPSLGQGNGGAVERKPPPDAGHSGSTGGWSSDCEEGRTKDRVAPGGTQGPWAVAPGPSVLDPSSWPSGENATVHTRDDQCPGAPGLKSTATGPGTTSVGAVAAEGQCLGNVSSSVAAATAAAAAAAALVPDVATLTPGPSSSAATAVVAAAMVASAGVAVAVLGNATGPLSPRNRSLPLHLQQHKQREGEGEREGGERRIGQGVPLIKQSKGGVAGGCITT
ncbi:unnamed protein product, partial [Discosporangium mesarthrocarpum]